MNKLTMPATIIIVSLILGGSYYLVQTNKQKSVEQQQQMEQAIKVVQENKEYVAKQKSACLDVYTTEGNKWNNVSSWNYDEENDNCVVIYKDPKRKTEAQCNKELEESKAIFKDTTVPMYVYNIYGRCVDGTFTKTF